MKIINWLRKLKFPGDITGIIRYGSTERKLTLSPESWILIIIAVRRCFGDKYSVEWRDDI